MTKKREQYLLRSYALVSLALLLILTTFTYILDQRKANWVCGTVLLVLELIAFITQTVLSICLLKVRDTLPRWFILLASITLLTLVIIGFINFITNCS